MKNNPNEYPVEEERRKLEVESRFENDLAKPNRTDPLSNEFENNEMDQEIHKDLDTPMGQNPLSDEYESNELDTPPANMEHRNTEPHAMETTAMERNRRNFNDAEPNGMNPDHQINNDIEPNGMDPKQQFENGHSFQKTPGEIHTQNMDRTGKEPNSINPDDKWK
ncbi:hypothetical protein QWT69_07585 [Sporosarcina oncorhynchi]|uniref:Uncharacterized protein n=1 Tax=Sporosarcina oncorhynchi TaxID=3056444 RepID=A0ABZ0L9Z0_9BACL|nr:hypothetical protein [Sporosarcina sp. T2O-4]WOV88955.1 hypothetical protein QWT69_07585 [Sporosarcina sp. T2O-4]